MLTQIITVVNKNKRNAVSRLSWGEETAGNGIIRTPVHVQTFLNLGKLLVDGAEKRVVRKYGVGGTEGSQEEPSSCLVVQGPASEETEG